MSEREGSSVRVCEPSTLRGAFSGIWGAAPTPSSPGCGRSGQVRQLWAAQDSDVGGVSLRRACALSTFLRVKGWAGFLGCPLPAQRAGTAHLPAAGTERSNAAPAHRAV